MDKEIEIEEMAKIIQQGELDRNRGDLDCSEFPTSLVIQVGMQRLAGAKAIYNADYRKQRVGRWRYDEENECFVCDCGCSALNNYRGLSVNSEFCPHCGAKMKGDSDA